jgi:hypothetical protein
MKDNIASGFISPDPQVVNTKDLRLYEPMTAVG